MQLLKRTTLILSLYLSLPFSATMACEWTYPKTLVGETMGRGASQCFNWPIVGDMFLRYIWQLSYTELLSSSTHIVRTVEVNIENHYIKFYVNTRNIRTCTHIKISFSKAVIQTTVLKLNGSKIAGCCIYNGLNIFSKRFL